ncbi:MAG: ABC transporter substrate-binding protein [Rhizobiales bacterium PAR1]|nr:MAG: ABC transporter substrate-binding protein [Rhizobiales bacterium PAR1]
MIDYADKTTRRNVLKVSAGLGLAALTRPALAQTFPTRPISLVVPFTPGGSTDILARLLALKIEAATGQTVITENKAGAGGSIGSAAVAHAAPDGHTLLLGHIGTLAVNPSLYVRLPYDPLKSFAPIGMIARVHNVLAVAPDLPVKSVADLIAYAKARPGALNYASGGKGSAAHIATEAFADAAGIKLEHVPYRGTAPAVQDLLGGRIQLMLTGAPVLLPFIRESKLRGLGVSGLMRIAAAPELPTLAEAALPGFEASQWYGLVAPAATPPAILDRLAGILNAALADPETVAKLAPQGADVWPMTPVEFRTHIGAEIARWGGLIRRAGITPD